MIDPALEERVLGTLRDDEPPHAPLGRQPVQVLYGGAHLFREDSPQKLGDLARRALRDYGDVLALPEPIATRVAHKLEREPIEDLRIDFEDGFGVRSDDEEDEAAVRTARALARSAHPAFVGIRIRALDSVSGRRALRTLDRFLTALVEAHGSIPERFVVTLPKVTSARATAALADVLDHLEDRLQQPRGAASVEIMVEHVAALFDPEGRLHLPAIVAAARGRCVAAHLGTYDHTASCGVVAAEQRPDHPAADFARQIMLVSLAGRVRLADGATTTLPIAPHRGEPTAQQREENRAVMTRAWQAHMRDVRRGLALGFYQGWDLHPAQLVSRYAAVFTFFRDALPDATARLSTFLERAARASRVGEVFDDAATGQGLLNFFSRAHGCGAIDDDEVRAAGLSPDELHVRSFSELVSAPSRSRAP